MNASATMARFTQEEPSRETAKKTTIQLHIATVKMEQHGPLPVTEGFCQCQRRRQELNGKSIIEKQAVFITLK